MYNDDDCPAEFAIKMADVTVNVKAYCKIMLHAAKYPHSAVNGLLLTEDTKTKDSRRVRFIDTIPLFHIALGLTPMLEAALMQIDAYCRHNSLVIGGYYQANENYIDNKPDNIATVIGKKIHDYFSDACLFMVDNRRVSEDSKVEAYKIYSWKETHWKETDRKHTTEEEAITIASLLLENGEYRKLHDFDNHLDDVTCDWRNSALNEFISTCT